MSSWRALSSAAAAIMFVACVDLSTDVSEVTSIAIVPPEAPSIVAGDSLRNIAGAVERLQAKVYLADGSLLADAPVTFFTRDTTIVITADNKVFAKAGAADSVARIFAITSAGGTLQSVALELPIAQRPDTVSPNGAVTPLELLLPESPLNVSGDLGVLVRGKNAAGVLKGSRGFIVTFALQRRDGTVVSPTDTSAVYLQNPASGRPSSVDTTDASGIATRRVRVVATSFQPLTDTVIVLATVRFKGQPLPGSPVRLLLPIRPKQ